MGTRFNWQTEEEDWETARETERQRKTGRRRGPLLILAVIVAAALAVVYWQVTRQTDAIVADIEADLQASVDIIGRAQQGADLELFRSVLSGRDPAWTEAQRDVFRAGLLYDRPALDLHWQGPAAAAPVITLADELDAAEYTLHHTYRTVDSRGVTATIQLETTTVYRTGSNRWLLAPPLSDFWGDWVHFDAPNLDLYTPARDRDVAERLVTDLNEMLASLCTAVPELACEAAAPLPVRLSKDPSTLLLTGRTEAYRLLEGQQTLELPAITLVGRPTDEAGYQAVLRGYARQVASAALSRWAGYECCRHGLYWTALVDYLLAAQDLRAWPVTDAVYADLLDQGASLVDADTAWYTNLPEAPFSEHRLAVYGVVEFLIASAPGGAPGHLLTTLNTNGSFQEWLSLSVQAANRFQVEQAWYVFVLGHVPQQVQTTAWPATDLLLACQVNDNSAQTVWRYGVETSELRFVKTINSPGRPLALADDAGFLLQLNPNFEVLQQRFLWPDGSETVILPPDSVSSDSMYLINEFPASTGRLLWGHNLSAGERTFSYLDPAACRGAESCRAQPIDGLPFWAPDNAHALMLIPDRELELWLTDETGRQQQLIVAHTANSEGILPFWLTESRFGYSDSAFIYIFDLAAEAGLPREVTRLRRADLIADLFPNQALTFNITQIVPQPTATDSLLIFALDPSSSEQFIIQYDLTTGAKQILYVGPGIGYNARLNSDAGSITITELPPRMFLSLAAIVDLDGRFIRRYPRNDITRDGPAWSPDGDWLALLPGGRHLLLAVPAADYQEVRPLALPPDQVCYSAIWTAPENGASS